MVDPQSNTLAEETRRVVQMAMEEGYRAGLSAARALPSVANYTAQRAIAKAASDFVRTLYARCEHDDGHHDLRAVERYLVVRWYRAL